MASPRLSLGRSWPFLKVGGPNPSSFLGWRPWCPSLRCDSSRENGEEVPFGAQSWVLRVDLPEHTGEGLSKVKEKPVPGGSSGPAA